MQHGFGEVVSRNTGKPMPAYKPGEGMIAIYGAGPKDKYCSLCAKYVVNGNWCRVNPYVQIKYRGKTCGKFVEQAVEAALVTDAKENIVRKRKTGLDDLTKSCEKYVPI